MCSLCVGKNVFLQRRHLQHAQGLARHSLVERRAVLVVIVVASVLLGASHGFAGRLGLHRVGLEVRYERFFFFFCLFLWKMRKKKENTMKSERKKTLNGPPPPKVKQRLRDPLVTQIKNWIDPIQHYA